MFANLLIILASSLVVIALFRRLRLPPVLGYLCVGLLVGPTAFDWVNESEHLPDVAELGVVFLLFSLGLEFSLSKMIALRQVVFRSGQSASLDQHRRAGTVADVVGHADDACAVARRRAVAVIHGDRDQRVGQPW